MSTKKQQFQELNQPILSHKPSQRMSQSVASERKLDILDDSVTFHFAHVPDETGTMKEDLEDAQLPFSVRQSSVKSVPNEKEFQKLVKQYQKSKKKYQKQRRKAMRQYAKHYRVIQSELSDLDQLAAELGCSLTIDLEPVLQIPYTVFLGVHDAKRARAESKMTVIESVLPDSLDELSPAQFAMAKQSSQVSQYIRAQVRQQITPRLQGELSKMMFFSN